MTAEDHELAVLDALVTKLDGVDPADPLAADTFASALSSPQSIAVTEGLEVLAKKLWRPVIQASTPAATDALQFSRFFAGIGFLKKYKPYGTKFATPFGYSIFALEPAMGFSVQLHRVAKVEAFHILAVHQDGFVLLCDTAEWEADGRSFIEEWQRGKPLSSNLVRQPAPGDVFVIERLETVHSIIGCTLEEFATTSNDAVDRLFDQNAAINTTFPANHRSLVDVLTSCGEVTPRRRIRRERGLWATSDIDGDRDALVELPDSGLRGRHFPLSRGEAVEVSSDSGAILSFACLTGTARVRMASGTLKLGLGDTVPVAPGTSVVLEAVSEFSRVAACSVATELAFGDFRAPGGG